MGQNFENMTFDFQKIEKRHKWYYPNISQDLY